MDFLTGKLPEGARKVFGCITKCLGLATFIIISWKLFLYGNALFRAGEVSPTLRMPIYYIAYAIGFCCLVECLILFYELLRTLKRVTT